jgi:hypothetical protein
MEWPMTGESLEIKRLIELEEDPFFYAEDFFRKEKTAALLTDKDLCSILDKMGFIHEPSDEWEIKKVGNNFVIRSRNEIQIREKNNPQNNFSKITRLIFEPHFEKGVYVLTSVKFGETKAERIQWYLIRHIDKIRLILKIFLALSAVILLAPLLAKIGRLGLIGEGLASTVNWIVGITPNFMNSIGSFFSNAVTGLASNVITISPEFSSMATTAATVFLMIGSFTGILALVKVLVFRVNHPVDKPKVMAKSKKTIQTPRVEPEAEWKHSDISINVQLPATNNHRLAADDFLSHELSLGEPEESKRMTPPIVMSHPSPTPLTIAALPNTGGFFKKPPLPVPDGVYRVEYAWSSYESSNSLP